MEENEIVELEVESIELSENEDVYDLRTETHHNFFANGVLVHNCGEEPLENGETCNLSELFLSMIFSEEEMYDCARLLYKTQKAVCNMKYIHDITTKVVHKNQRIGIGVSGFCQKNADEKFQWLSNVYEKLEQYDKQWSKENGYNESIRLTTSKPSGCTILDTKIKTNHGIISMEELFIMTGLTKDEVIKLVPNTWIYQPNKNIKAYDMNNNLQDITMLYFNGEEEIFEVEFEDGVISNFTGNHKLLTNNGWKRVDQLTTDDDIISF